MNAISGTRPRAATVNASAVEDDGGPSPIDVHVGSRVRLRRTLLGMSQTALGDAIGLTFQQVQKYERGANRISASRLWALSNVLDVPVSFFFDDMPAEVAAVGSTLGGEGSDAPTARVRDDAPNPMTKRETLELVRNYYGIRDGGVRRGIYDLVRAASRADGEGAAS